MAVSCTPPQVLQNGVCVDPTPPPTPTPTTGYTLQPSDFTSLFDTLALNVPSVIFMLVSALALTSLLSWVARIAADRDPVLVNSRKVSAETERLLKL